PFLGLEGSPQVAAPTTGAVETGAASVAPVSKDDEGDSWPILVDHDACILCDRCVRGCDVIKEHHVIGRLEKGYAARIAFDLDVPMKTSTCVTCGECADDCPTGALRHRGEIAAQLPGETVTVKQLIEHENPRIRRAFRGVSLPFLRANIHAIKRRKYVK